ncbi:helicase HerA domain-containing protein [Candidatus Terasakiella magnetica]|uniref:helicase HerA domain-containing protein n=1 Tax=Candidatus Terasakiella magnetica TaxID=1867952 RepID=UPI000840C25E|nr:DUF87 domain-containing protein [Candidatus Terasakiella magnetica]
MVGFGQAYIAVIFKNILSNFFASWQLRLDKERLKHTHILASTGGGKSSAITFLIDENVRKNKGFLLIEPHGEMVQRILSNKRFSLAHPSKAYKQLVYLNFDEDPPQLNVFKLPLPKNPNIRQAFIDGLASELTDALGHNMQPVLTEAQYVMLRNIFIAGFYLPQATFQGIVKLLSTEGNLLLPQLISQLPTPPLQDYFTNDFLSGNARRTRDALRLRLNNFLIPRQIYQSFCASECEVDFAAILAENKFVVVRATTSLLGNYEAKTIGNIIHNLLSKYAFERLLSGKPCNPFFAYFDEAQHYLNGSVHRGLTGARKTGLNYTLAHHELNQEGISPQQQRSIVNNCNVKIYGNLKWKDQKEAAAILRLEKPEMIERLRPGEFFIKAGKNRVGLKRFPFKFAIKKEAFGRGWLFNAFARWEETKKLLDYLKRQRQKRLFELDSFVPTKPELHFKKFSLDGRKP